jgi:hypothetical protein
VSPLLGGHLFVAAGRVAQRAQVVVKTRARGVEVEEARLAGALVAEGVGDQRRGHDERARTTVRRLSLGAQLEGELPVEDVEGVGVLAVDVQVRAALPRCVTRLGHDQQLVPGLDPDRAAGVVGGDLAGAGRDDERVHAAEYSQALPS